MEQVQRNEPCPCGSSKKYKKCCMNSDKMKLILGGFSFKGKSVYFVLIALIFLSIFLRYYGFQQPHGLTFDEGLYSELIAEQLKENPRLSRGFSSIELSSKSTLERNPDLKLGRQAGRNPCDKVGTVEKNIRPDLPVGVEIAHGGAQARSDRRVLVVVCLGLI